MPCSTCARVGIHHEVPGIRVRTDKMSEEVDGFLLWMRPVRVTHVHAAKLQDRPRKPVGFTETPHTLASAAVAIVFRAAIPTASVPIDGYAGLVHLDVVGGRFSSPEQEDELVRAQLSMVDGHEARSVGLRPYEVVTE